MGDFQQNTITNRQAVLDYIDANSGGGGSIDYTEYVAYITQNAPNDPIPFVAKNDTGFTFAYTYNNTGDYTITATGAFPDYEKVIPSFNGQGGAGFTNVFWNNSDTLGVLALDSTGLASDGIFIGNLTIRIYN